MDDRQFRNAMGTFVTGITIITTEVENEVYGMTANAFTSVSLDPKLILVAISNNAKMLSHIQHAKKFAVSFLASDQIAQSMHFAGQIKYAEPYEFARLNSHPVINDALANITCNVYSEFVAGDHTLFIGEVTDICLNEGDPLLFYQGKYRELKNFVESLTV
jgi:flavin reductase (DIM6/NTAB) family NADH-FMN oxidoreductase RutF